MQLHVNVHTHSHTCIKELAGRILFSCSSLNRSRQTKINIVV